MNLFSKFKSNKLPTTDQVTPSVTNTELTNEPVEIEDPILNFQHKLGHSTSSSHSEEANIYSSPDASGSDSTISLAPPPHRDSDNPFSQLQHPTTPTELETPPPSPHRKSSDDSETSNNSEKQFETQVEKIKGLLSSKRDQFLSGARIRDRCEVAKTRTKEKVELSYAVFGSGTRYKVMLVMGLNGIGATWFLQTEYFSKLEDYQVCVFDNRGIGNSSAPKGFYSTKAMAEDALELLDHLGWESEVHLVGVSLGGMIVQKMVSYQPDRFSTLLCTSTFHASFDFVPTPAEVKFFLTSFHKPWDEQIDPLLKLCFPKQWLNAQVEKGIEVTNYQFISMAMEELNKLSPPQTKEASLSQMHSTWVHYTTPKECKTIRHSKVRTLVIHGSKDKVIRYQCGKVLSKALKCPLITFEKCGHMVMIEQPVRFNQVLQAHFEGRLIESNAQIIPLSTHFETSPLPTNISRPSRTESDPTRRSSTLLSDENIRRVNSDQELATPIPIFSDHLVSAPRSLIVEDGDEETPEIHHGYLSPPTSSVVSSNQEESELHPHQHKSTGKNSLRKKTSWLNLKLPNSIKHVFSKEHSNHPERATTM
ncbi:hypothetical protein K7432_012484 [Basidiobolus ranarum]|uniref:AB hydrolase-1 domain-containing protein n=1 Tax=Basidiobolus ranarum TaxID=34480 RepID=A0ABR2VSB1_9FUNG